MKKSNLTVYKDNILVEASYKLSLIEQRLMLFCIGKLNPVSPDQKQVITIDEFIAQFPDVTKKNAYNQIKNAVDDLSERWIRVKNPKSVKEFRWIQSKEYRDDQGSAVIEFSNAVMPYLCQLEKQFTKYQLRNVSGFKRTYSIRLYELLTQYRDLKEREISLKDLRELLFLGDKFPLIHNFKARVLEPAIDEINTKSDLRITYTQVKKGRVVYGFNFQIKVDKQIDMFERSEIGKRNIKKIKDSLKNKGR